MLAQIMAFSYQTEAFVKTEVVCTVHFLFTILGCRVVKNLKKIVYYLLYCCKLLSGWVVKNSLKTSNVMQILLVDNELSLVFFYCILNMNFIIPLALKIL